MNLTAGLHRLGRSAATAPVLIVAILVTIGLSQWAAASTLTDDELSTIRQTTSTYQARVLDDAIVTEAEYRTSTSDWHDCVAATGAVTDPVTSPETT